MIEYFCDGLRIVYLWQSKNYIWLRRSLIRDLKIYDAIARRRVTKTKHIFIEDNNYE